MEFLEKDLEESEKQAKALADCLFMASFHGYSKDYHQVANYLEMAARSAKVLGDLKMDKEIAEEVGGLLQQIKQRGIRVVVYEK